MNATLEHLDEDLIRLTHAYNENVGALSSLCKNFLTVLFQLKAREATITELHIHIHALETHAWEVNANATLIQTLFSQVIDLEACLATVETSTATHCQEAKDLS